MVPQSLITKRLKIYKIYNKIIKFITNAMAKWRMELMTGGQTLVEVKIQSSTGVSSWCNG